MLRFRSRLVAAPTLEAFYFDLFRRDVAVPPPFVHHTAQVILRSVLDGVENGLQARAAELDDLLGEIDSVLETNAESFVRGFVQKGGQ